MEGKFADGRIIRLETRPVDLRHPLSSDYLILLYTISDVPTNPASSPGTRVTRTASPPRRPSYERQAAQKSRKSLWTANLPPKR